jgi:hypothetical protein
MMAISFLRVALAACSLGVEKPMASTKKHLQQAKANGILECLSDTFLHGDHVSHTSMHRSLQ